MPDSTSSQTAEAVVHERTGSDRERELLEGVEWGYAMIKALVNHAGGEVVLDKETINCGGRLEVTQTADKTYVRCWKGMTQ